MLNRQFENQEATDSNHLEHIMVLIFFAKEKAEESLLSMFLGLCN